MATDRRGNEVEQVKVRQTRFQACIWLKRWVVTECKTQSIYLKKALNNQVKIIRFKRQNNVESVGTFEVGKHQRETMVITM